MEIRLPSFKVNLFEKWQVLLILPLLIFTSLNNLKAQSFFNTQQTDIPNPGTVSVPITVSGLRDQIDTLTFGLQSVNVKITHPTLKELTLKLQSPDGKVILLSRKSPGTDYNTTFNAVALKFIDNNEIASYSGNYSGGYRPRQDLSLLNNGQDPNGAWKLIVTDDNSTSADGIVTGFTLVFGTSPAKPLLTLSNLPIIKIYTDNGADIVDDPKVLGNIYIINNGAGAYNSTNQSTYQYQGKIGIEIRGNSSATDPNLPKRQYGFETRAADGVTSTDISFFGMPKQSDWILSAVMSDKSLMRNVLTYQIARDMGRWASRTQYCELIINDEYRGVFIFEEKIKKDKNRVPIEKMVTTDITEPNVTGGYIFSVDDPDPGDITWKSKFDPLPPNPFKFVYPKSEDLQPAQRTYLQNYVDDFETALHGDNFKDSINGFRKFINDSSFIDYFLISEIAKNFDSYRWSTYFHKTRSGKIMAGPVWDFDRGFRNEETCNSFLPSGYISTGLFECGGRIVPWWWARLLEDTKYKQDLVCRYNTLRQSTLSMKRLNYIIDSSAALLNAGAQQRNFIRWNIFGKYVERIPKPYSATYTIEIDTLKQWINNRLNWLDNDLGSCTAPAQYTLSVTATNGTVAKSPNQTSYTSGTSVKLTSTPASGYQFSNWSGDATGTANPLTVSMNGNKNITADFTAVKYILSVSSANGTVAKNPDQVSYTSGSNVTLTATADPGYQFTGWSGDTTGTTSPLTVTMNGNKNITANFTAIKYTLSVSATNGTVAKSPDQANYASGDNVTLTATADPGYQFNSWSGDTTGTASSLTVTMNGNKSITAVFTTTPAQYTLSVLSENGSVAKSPYQTSYTSGDNVTLTASAANGYQFSNWSGDTTSAANPLTVSMNGNKSIAANFTAIPPDMYSLTVIAANGSVTKSPDQTSYTSGDHVTLTATATSGYQFSSWSGDTSGSDNPLMVSMNGNKNITANFTAIPTQYTLSVSAVNGLVAKSPDQTSYTSGDNVTLTATAASGYQFSSWSGDASGFDNPLTVSMNGNKNIAANFTAVPTQYTLLVSAANGLVAKSPDQTSYTSGDNVTLTATAASGYQFSSWSGDASGSANPLTVSMNGNKSITANFTTVSEQPVTTLAPVADAFVRNGTYATKNYGTDTSLVVKSTTSSGYTRLAYLKFSLGSLSNVSSAKLHIYGSNTQNTSGIAITGYGVDTDAWTETGITWNNMSAASSAALSSVSVTNQARYYELDVTTFVKSQLSGDKTASFLIKDPSNKNINLVFNSKENAANKPQLVVVSTAGSNQAPVLASIGNKTITAGQTLTFTATAADPDAGQTKTFSLVSAPGSALIGVASGAFSWTPSAAGSFSFKIRVTDNGSPALYDEEQITVTVAAATSPAITLTPNADAFVRNGSYAANNYGSGSSLVVKSDVSSGYSRSSYLKFSLGSVSSTISSAKLRIYGSNTQSTAAITVAAYGVTNDAWTETGITWNNAPAAASAVLSSVSVTNQAKYYELDVTGFVKAQVTGDKTASFLIKDPASKSINLAFNSKENAANKPQLLIQTSSAATGVLASQFYKNTLSFKNNASRIKVYPNPVQKRFIVQLPERYQGKLSLQIIDELGKIHQVSNPLLNNNAMRIEADISHLSLRPGLYFLKIISATKTEVIKLSIQ